MVSCCGCLSDGGVSFSCGCLSVATLAVYRCIRGSDGDSVSYCILPSILCASSVCEIVSNSDLVLRKAANPSKPSGLLVGQPAPLVCTTPLHARAPLAKSLRQIGPRIEHHVHKMNNKIKHSIVRYVYRFPNNYTEMRTRANSSTPTPIPIQCFPSKVISPT